MIVSWAIVYRMRDNHLLSELCHLNCCLSILHFSLAALELVKRRCTNDHEADHDLLHEVVRT